MSDFSQRDRRRLSDAAVDEALASWPMPERDAIEWDEAAARVQDRIESGAAPSDVSASLTDDDLLGAPLAAEHDEMGSTDSVPPHPPVSVSSRSVRPRRSFKDLAELAKSAPPPPVLVEAGVGVEAGIAAAAAVEVQAEIAAAEIVAPVVVAAVPQATPAAVVPIRAASATAPGEKNRTTAIVSVAVAGLALAATIAFFVRTSHHEATPAPVAQTPVATPIAAPKPSTAVTTAPKDDAIDPMALPLANAPTATTATPLLPMAPVATATSMASAAPPPSASAAPTPDPSAVASAAPAPSSTESLEEQMRQAAGPSVSATAAPSAADTSTAPSGNLPLKPSQGAVSGAIGAVMPAARACLDADDPVSHATIVFRSDGSVKSVSLDGGIVGKPAEACVRGALMKAHVTPFAQPEFMGFATIRPN